MKIAMMQPYFLPYIGYFQLIGSVDLFVLFDDLKYTQKRWINRNRILINGRPAWITLPLRKDATSRHIRDRLISNEFDRAKMLRRIELAYRRAPQFESLFPTIKKIVDFDEIRLSNFIYNSVSEICDAIDIKTKIVRSSEFPSGASERTKRILEWCRAMGATTYINPIGGVALYSKKEFARHGVDLKFLHSRAFEYPQFGNEFVASLSILDVLMFNTTKRVRFQVENGFDVI